MKKIIISLAALLYLSACTKEEIKAPLTVPTSYVSASYDANTVSEKALRTQLADLTTEMKTAENGTVLSSVKITDLFTKGTPSLKSITGAYYVGLLENELFKELINTSGKVYDPAKPNSTGGVFGARLLNSGGLETLQVIEKGLFGAAFYNYATTLMSETVTPKTIDQLLAIYGASLAFPATNTATKTTTPDAFGALYAARRDKNDGNGMYSKIKSAFLKAQAATIAGTQYNAERDEAFGVIKSEWERSFAATVIHYNFTAITKFSTTNAPATTLSGGLHDLGEGVGFLHGFKAVPQAQRKITDAQIDELLLLLTNTNAGKVEMYKYTTDPSILAKIQSVSTKVQAIYGFTATDMEDFKKNWIAEQVR